MKAVIFLLLMLCLPVQASEISISGPTEADPGEMVRLRLDGLPDVDLAGVVADEVEWFDSLTLAFSPPVESTTVIDEELTMTVRPFRWRYRVEFVPDRLGAYLIVVSWRLDDADQLLVHRVEVGGSRPDPPEPDPDPDDPIPPPTDGLHVIVVDDENVRGELPQSQINIFTSTRVAEWLRHNTAEAPDGGPAFRFSSSDSLVEGEEARELELPVFVEGWDAIMDAVRSGRISLPAWAISDGERGVIEQLPQSVDAAIERLEEFR